MTEKKRREPIEGHPFRFFDNREKYLLFVTTTSEKTVVAHRIGQELSHLKPKPPALRLFDAGMGDGSVLAHVLRELHCAFPTVPQLIVGKEISLEDVRLTLSKLADRLAEHPQTVVVLTNMFYSEAPWLTPKRQKDKIKWWDLPLQGSTAHDFNEQLESLENVLNEGWQTKSSPKTGNPIYVNPSVMVLYRSDHAFALNSVIPKKGKLPGEYDLVLAAQPFRGRTPAKSKVSRILRPLAQSLAVNGRMIVVQSTGLDPGMEIIRKIWPDEDPFVTPRHVLMMEIDRQLNGDDREDPVFLFEGHGDDKALFTYHLHSMPGEVSSSIGTSTMLAAWNAAVYVAQVDDRRINEVLQSGKYLDVTREVVQKHGGLWFQDESFVVVKRRET